MPSQKYLLSPEFCARRKSHPPNPALLRCLSFLRSGRKQNHLRKCADLGCGKLRHLNALRAISNELVLVDTERQLSRVHTDRGHAYSIDRVASGVSDHRHTVEAMTFERFVSARLGLDVIFCIAVFDCVLRPTRKTLIAAAARNLRGHGLFVVIVPRNDSSIMRRCTKLNKYKDGHVFHHHGITTFFRNFVSCTSIIHDCEAVGLTLYEDQSRHKQACLLFIRSGRAKK